MADRKRYVGIDVMRLAVSVIVVLYHVDERFGCVVSGMFPFLSRYGGYFANYFFFMASGFCTAMRSDGDPGGFFGYMRRRLSGIYPMYLLSNLAILFVGGTDVSGRRIVETVFLVSTGWHDGDGMPLNYPCMFVCIWMICHMAYWCVRKLGRRRETYMGLCVAFVIWGMVLEAMDWDVPLNYVMCGEGYMNFFIGALLAESFGRAGKGWLAGVCCEALGVVMLACACLDLDSPFLDFRWIVSFVCVCLVGIALDDRWSRLDGTVVGRMYGPCSMLVFLWHIPVIRCMLMFTDGAGITVPASWAGLFVYLGVLTLFVSCLYFLRMKFAETRV